MSFTMKTYKMKIKRGSANSKIAMVANLFNSPIWNFLRYKEYATVIIIKIAPIKKRYSLYPIKCKLKLHNDKKDNSNINYERNTYNEQKALNKILKYLDLPKKEIDMKNEERRKRVEELKKEISNKWKKEQIKREKKCLTANMKKNESHECLDRYGGRDVTSDRHDTER